MKQFKYKLLVFLFLLSQVGAANPNESSSGKNFKRGVATVMFATLGGAVLGLSTLSFYSKPQEHTGNITTGALIGLIAGIGYLSYERTPKMTQDTSLTESERQNQWSQKNGELDNAPIVASWQWSF